jgi:hypothetical protein
MGVLYTSEQVADIVRMAIERDRLERAQAPLMPPAKSAEVPAGQPASQPAAGQSDKKPDDREPITLPSLAEFARTAEQQNKQRDAIRTKALR